MKQGKSGEEHRVTFLSTTIPEEIRERRERRLRERIRISIQRLILRSLLLNSIPFFIAAIFAILKVAKGICFLTNMYPVWTRTGLLPRISYLIKDYLFLLIPIFSFNLASGLLSWLHRTSKRSGKLFLYLSWSLRIVISLVLAFESFYYFPERSEVMYPILKPKILFLLEHGNIFPYHEITVGGTRTIPVRQFFQEFSDNLKNVEAIGVYTCFSWYIIRSMRKYNPKVQYFGINKKIIIMQNTARWHAVKDFYEIILTGRIPKLRGSVQVCPSFLEREGGGGVRCQILRFSKDVG